MPKSNSMMFGGWIITINKDGPGGAITISISDGVRLVSFSNMHGEISFQELPNNRVLEQRLIGEENIEVPLYVQPNRRG